MTPAGSVVAGRLTRSPELEDVLLGVLGPAKVRDVVLHPCTSGLGELVDWPLADTAARLELVRTKFKPARKLTGCYRLLQEGRPPLPLVITWSLSSTSDGVDLSVLCYPHDPSMPQVSRLTSTYLQESLAALTGLPPAPGAGAETEVVRYRPGQRHVLSVRTRSDAPAVFVKVDRDDSGRRAVPVARTLARVLASAEAGAPVEPLGYRHEDHAAFWWGSAGEPLSVLLVSDPTSSRNAVALAGRALRAVHDFVAPPDALPEWWTGLPTTDVAVEARNTLRAAEHIRALQPTTGRRHADGVGQVATALETLEAEAAVLAHGDYKGDNVLVHEGQVRLLDLDRVRLAEPAMDLGKLLADLRWWCHGDAHREHELAAALSTGYGPCPRVRWSRARLYATLYGLKAVARRVPLHASTWAAEVDRSTAAAVLPSAWDETRR